MSADDTEEDERRKRQDVEPFAADGAFNGPLPPDAPLSDEFNGPPPPDEPAKPQTAAQTRSVPMDTTKPVDGLTPDRCLIYGIAQAGLAGLFKARDLGLKPEHLDTPENKIYELFEQFIPKTRLPTVIEIRATVGITIDVPQTPFDVETFAGRIVTRALRKKLRDGLQRVIENHLVTDPAAARDELGKLVRETSWSLGHASSYTDPATAQNVYDSYMAAKDRGGGLLGLSSPWPNVDAHSLGLQEGELTVLLAKRKMGKSWLLLKWFLHIYKTDLKPGECLLIVSMEMPVSLCYRRLAAIDLRLPYKEMRAGKLVTAQEEKLAEWVEQAKQIDPTKPTIHVLGPNTVRDVADIAAKTAELRPRGVGIDGLYILGRRTGAAMWERTIDNVSQIKLDLCAGLNVPVLATTQFKGSKSKNDLQADADDAAYAKAIGDWADSMRGLVADGEMDGNNQRLFRGMESREFRPVDLLINFDLGGMNFDEIKIVENSDEFAGAGDKNGKKADNKSSGATQQQQIVAPAMPPIIASAEPPPGEGPPIPF